MDRITFVVPRLTVWQQSKGPDSFKIQRNQLTLQNIGLTMDGKIVSDAAEFATLKNDVGHIEKAVIRIEGEVSEINKNHASISESLAVLTAILKHSQDANEKRNIRLDKQDEEIKEIRRFMYKMTGAIAVISGIASMLAPVAIKALGVS